jgi:hypothetical protein
MLRLWLLLRLLHVVVLYRHTRIAPQWQAAALLWLVLLQLRLLMALQHTM